MGWPRLRLQRRGALAACAVLAGLMAAIALRRTIGQIAALLLGAGAVAFLALPLARLFEKRLSRPAASLCALAALAALVGVPAWLMVPAMLRDLKDLIGILPGLMEDLRDLSRRVSEAVSARLPGVALRDLPLPVLEKYAARLTAGSLDLAAGLAQGAGQAGMMVMLGAFLLNDRDRLLLRLEWLLPQGARRVAVRMGRAVDHELKLYLRGQLVIALAVGLLSTAGLMLMRVRSALVLGPIAGLLNVIPYFGPFLGAIPAVLIALTDGWRKAVMVAAVLTLVQQIDNALISPRVMGNLTGFSPAAVLLAVFAGARVGGVAGMLLAVPALLTLRTLFRLALNQASD